MKRELTIVAVMGLAWFALPTTALAIDSFFDVFTEFSAGPPYPGPPTQTLVSHLEGGLMVPTQILGVGLQVVDNNSPARIAAHDGGGGGGGGGGASVQSFFDIWTELSLDSYPVDSFFDIFLELSPPAVGATPPELISGSVFHIDSFFDIWTELSVGGGIENLHFHGEIGPGQPLMFTNVEPQAVFDSWFDVWVGCRRTGGPLLPGVPLFTIALTGNFVPEPATWMLLLLGGAFTGLARKR